MPTELGKTILLLKEEETPIRDVGKHVRQDRSRGLPLDFAETGAPLVM